MTAPNHWSAASMRPVMVRSRNPGGMIMFGQFVATAPDATAPVGAPRSAIQLYATVVVAACTAAVGTRASVSVWSSMASDGSRLATATEVTSDALNATSRSTDWP